MKRIKLIELSLPPIVGDAPEGSPYQQRKAAVAWSVEVDGQHCAVDVTLQCGRTDGCAPLEVRKLAEGHGPSDEYSVPDELGGSPSKHTTKIGLILNTEKEKGLDPKKKEWDLQAGERDRQEQR